MKRALDLCCKAGGASVGLHRAGYTVTGVDITPQPNYPFDFHCNDALDFPLKGYDLIWVSPPCQGYSAMRHAPGARDDHPLLIEPMRARLRASGTPYVIENVRAARRFMIDPVELSGDMFGLAGHGGWLLRQRLFECSFPVSQPPKSKLLQIYPVIGVYGGHCRIRAKRHGGRTTRDPWPVPHRQVASDLMGIDWMTMAELDEAIPPAYAEHIGRAALCAAS